MRVPPRPDIENTPDKKIIGISYALMAFISVLFTIGTIALIAYEYFILELKMFTRIQYLFIGLVSSIFWSYLAYRELKGD